MADVNQNPGPESSSRAPGLRGRGAECNALDQLIAQAQAGRAGVLVLRGEAGIGKSALLDYVLGRAAGCRTARAAGVESEMELAFAGLHQLCGPFLDRLPRLPGPQNEALGTAFGLRGGPAPDGFLVGLGVLSLLSDVADEQPLVCVVDDAQWLDHASAQALSFAVRRLAAEPIAMVLAMRDPTHERWEDTPALTGFTGLAELIVPGLVADDAQALLRSVVPGLLDEQVRDRIVAETRGNPLALLELPRGLTFEQLAGGFGLPDGPALAGRIEDTFRRRLEPLSADTRLLLVVAAADPVGDPALVWRAAHELGIASDAAPAAAVAGLVDFEGQVRFRHPLVRSAVYRAASPQQRRDVHAALAAATDSDTDLDRRAWHRAHATFGTNETVAEELEQSADRAQTRGGLAAAAAFLEEAARRSPDPTQRGRRALAAAGSRLLAGAPEAALSLIEMAEATPLDESSRAVADILLGRIAFGSSHGRDAPPLLLAAAKRLEPLDPLLARDTYLEALSAALFVGRLADQVGVVDVARSALTAPPSSARPPDLLLDGLAQVISHGYAAGAPMMKRAVTAFRDESMPVAEEVRWLWFATHAAHDVWDDGSWEVLCTRHVQLARQSGALTVLPFVLSARMGLHLFAGELDVVASLVEEVAAVAEATGSRFPPYGAIALAAWRGRDLEASKLIANVLDDVVSRGEGMGLTLIQHAKAVLYNGLGRYPDALDAATQGAAHPQELAFAAWSLVELVEAAARSGHPDHARDALARLALSTRASGTDWALGIEARSRALVSEGDVVELLYREAIDRLARTLMRAELARAHLLYGEWLRREGRRVHAREQLRTAHELCTAMGLEAFAERCRRELLATGETVRKRSLETYDELTAQEAHIARLAGGGKTNPEIAAELFISPRTVEWHLGNVFSKLGISTRRELRGAVTTAPASI